MLKGGLERRWGRVGEGWGRVGEGLGKGWGGVGEDLAFYSKAPFEFPTSKTLCILTTTICREIIT